MTRDGIAEECKRRGGTSRRQSGVGECVELKILPKIFHTMIRFTMMGILILFVFGMKINTTVAQETGIDVCGCSPSTYTFVLDFGMSCLPTNITTGSGVTSVSCLISPFGAPTTNLIPVVIDSISVIELDQANNVIVEERINEDFFNGDSFSYSSILNNNPEDITSSRQIPKALQLNLNGKNREGIMLMNVFIVTFSNECGVFPVIQNGESAGWAIFSQMNDPILGFCPTRAPSSTLSIFPSQVPTDKPSDKPSNIPTSKATNEPTDKPTDEPTTEKPSNKPTNKPSDKPSHIPTSKPTNGLIYEPTRIPSASPTYPVTIPRRTQRPTNTPTAKPTHKRITSTPSSSSSSSAPDTISSLPTTTTPLFMFTELPTQQLSLGTTTGHSFPPTSIPVSSASGIPSAFDDYNYNNMSMSMSLSFAWGDVKSLQLIEDELDVLDEFFNKN